MDGDLIDGRRRRFMSLAAGGALAAAAPMFSPLVFATGTRTLKIGYVSPQTGPLAPFGEADRFTIQQMQGALKNGVSIAGKTYPVSIVVKDSQSNPNRASEVANDLILKDKVDIMLVSGTPETANPVSDACELNETPCVSTVVPWQPWFFGRKGDPKKGFSYTYHFFWGLEDVIAVYTGMWQSVQTNRSVGGLFPNDGDGNAWGDAKLGFPPVLAQKGFALKDPGRFQSMTQDFSAQISAFRQSNAQIVTGVVIPPDAKNFLVQARQQGLKPKVISIGKALLFPTSIEALGDLGEGLSTEVWWSPSHPFRSSLTGQNARQVADEYERVTSKQWTQPIGFAHALFEIAIDSFRRAKDIDSNEAIRDAVASTKLDTLVGHVEWGNGPVKNVAKTPLVGGQWVKGQKHRFDLAIVNNQLAPAVPVSGPLRLIA
ncbi:ABC transporter substrate-binding protein [Paraburkholderia diazotrophica]|uniref:Amino acid/amide ABC transporter substrate-binding protein, HAAT family n=1 Tax=Paraburkholderia diazotrophica TaxID=667676 RepID=A0A1H7EBP2_9BURK|nr:ABC transporter substrate-binding protein [Paraburkholderia diazotrophica]SEK11298.1 amino acid/amide ABC transporter substrate-binding protein, HAAT family [Paraburkholderia diazotrophica]